MELRRWIQVLCILPALQDFLDFRVYSMKCPDTHYLRHGDHERCCLKCNAGERVERHCLVGQNYTTKCKSCGEGTYQAAPNGETRCRTCRKQYKQFREDLKPCTRFNDSQYGDCIEGFYHNLAFDSCLKCHKCPVGYGVKKECTKDSNTECDEEKCGMRTFSDQESLTQKCTQCTVCKNGEEMYKACTTSSNSGCRKRNITPTPTEIIITSTTSIKTASKSTPPDNRGTNAGREEGQSWVVPFFIAAMALLLILFLAFVIGVTVWCHIQSRNRQQNIIVQAEDPQVVQRLTKLVDDVESVWLPNEESRYQCHDVPDRKPGRVQENDIMLRDISHDIIEELANFLNPTSPPSNWRKVASMLDFPWNVINNLALCPTTATQQLLERWGTKRDSTVYKLYLTLKDIGRDDAAEVLERLLVQPVPSCPKLV